MHLSIGCQLELGCEQATPLLVLVHVHSSLVPALGGPEHLQVCPESPYEVLTDQMGNRWCRLLARPGRNSLGYITRIQVPDHTDPVWPQMGPCPIEALPIETYRFLNASTYCDTLSLMDQAWNTFARIAPGWPQVQAISDWVHERIRFSYGSSQPHQTDSQ